ncbi:hypothetical protein GGS24DRAFT_514262 [Hypoxylon argillaceum]|nr:hypothetical protein GGS24DRAFT_514262 [Hypoxylon argillaceum]
MATIGNQEAILETVNYLESRFPSAQAHQHTISMHPSRSPTPTNQQSPQCQAPQCCSPPGVAADVYQSSLPGCPPPGLVRVHPPFPTPVRVVSNANASLFSDFAPYLDTGHDEDNNPVVVDLTCLICLQRKLDVPDRVTASDFNHARGARESMTILPCGHFFGSGCMARWIMENEWQEIIWHCPICRFELVYDCGHEIEPLEYDPDCRRARQVPMTLPEGGEIPHSCNECVDDEIDESIERLRRLLFPRYIVPGDYRERQSAEIMRHVSLEFRHQVWNFTMMRDEFNRW